MKALAPDLADIDTRVRQGDLAGAADLLEARLQAPATPGAPGETAMPWLQLAGLRRALRQPYRALAATEQALARAPLDFTALVMHAALRTQLADAGAGLAWHRAFAQRPAGVLPGPLAQACVEGETIHAAWQAARAAQLAAATEAVLQRADEDTGWRITRFRDNVLGRTRVYRSEPTNFFYPGLTEREFHPRAGLPWLAELEAATDAICAEMHALLQSQRAELVPYIQYGEHQALRQWQPLNHSRDWSAVHLLQQGRRIEANAAQCPQTMAMLARLPQPAIAGASPNAMFSLLAPHTAIPPHVGVNNARLVCHLPLVVPEGCWFRVGASRQYWREGEALVFDDTIEHEALNPTDNMRVVLIFDVWHPDLNETEREAVAAIITTESVSGALG